ncbi:type III-A CRISPR-associated RAMP protein Csm5 [Cuniculiplasma sp. SKW4]|uniref:type III-A CRISPR-associated RAMP protein Csm5 n=1 Tax=Cuniculiplasma sp. SKW4 TaxID=3400171 RepID=UPI003FD6BF3D
MIWELECVTPFIIKNGEKFSVMELLEEENRLYRIDTDSFSTNLSKEEIKEQNKLFDKFIEIKKKMTNQKGGNRNLKVSPNDYLEMWTDIQNFNRKNKASEHRLLPEIEKGSDFKRYYEFDDYLNIVIFEDKRKEFVPYIPGSTLKGLLRRMIHLEFIKLYSKNSGGKRIDIGNKYEDFNKRTEGKLKLLMQSIQVSDFYPSRDFRIKIDSVRRDPKGAKAALPLVQSGKFYGEVNVNLPVNLSQDLKEILSQIGISNESLKDTNTVENRIFNIVTQNSKIIIEQNQKRYNNSYYLGEAEEKNYLALGFGKGLSLSGFVSVKDIYNLALARIRGSRSSRHNDSELKEQVFPKTNWTVMFYIKKRNTMMNAKLGIFKVKNMGNGQMKDLKELEYILKGVEE